MENLRQSASKAGFFFFFFVALWCGTKVHESKSAQGQKYHPVMYVEHSGKELKLLKDFTLGCFTPLGTDLGEVYLNMRTSIMRFEDAQRVCVV